MLHSVSSFSLCNVDQISSDDPILLLNRWGVPGEDECCGIGGISSYSLRWFIGFCVESCIQDLETKLKFHAYQNSVVAYSSAMLQPSVANIHHLCESQSS